MFAQTYYEKNNIQSSKDKKISDLQEKIDSCNEQISILGKNEKQQEISNNIMQLQNQKKELETQKNELSQYENFKYDIVVIKLNINISVHYF